MGIGMGALDPNRKYVVVFEIFGPATKTKGDAFDANLGKLMKKYGGSVKLTWHAAKVPVIDPPGTPPGPAPAKKRKSGGGKAKPNP
jgi:hypothetical protein